MTTSRSRLFRKEAPVVGPGASVQASMTRKAFGIGRDGSRNRALLAGRGKSVRGHLIANNRSRAWQRAELSRMALVIAGLAVGNPPLMKRYRTRAAAPASAGVEWLVPEEAV